MNFLYAAAYIGLIVVFFRYSRSNQRFRGVFRGAGIAAAGAAGLSNCLEMGLILNILAALVHTGGTRMVFPKSWNGNFLKEKIRTLRLPGLAMPRILSREPGDMAHVDYGESERGGSEGVNSG